MTNNKQQTGVEYLVEQLFPKALSVEQHYHIEKAKEVEKERTINFAEDWYFNGSVMMKKIDVKNTIEEHFNKTYGGGEQ